jgi:transposase
MKSNSSFNVGTFILTKKVDREFNFFDSLFSGLKGKTKHLIESVKAFVNNRLDKCVSLSQITESYQQEWFECLGFKEIPKERTLYRDLERIGEKYCFIVEKYQQLLKQKNLIDNKQFVDFSSAYFEGDKAELGELGYSRDHQPGKKQITFGIKTGMNGIPTALTIQKGNVQDKKHMKFMLKISGKILEKGSLLIFDCGGNTECNKEKIIELEFNYLTLKPRHKETYKKYIEIYKKSPKEVIYANGIKYKCVKVRDENVKYIFHSKNLYKKLRKNRSKKFQIALKKGDKLLSKINKEKPIGEHISRRGNIIMKGEPQTSLLEIVNPYITNLEGFFILESSVDDESHKILKLYKNKDIAEKLIRNMKEGTELRPINHITKEAIIGYLVIVFLTNCLIQLTHFLNKDNVDKNLKLLKKKLNSLTVTFIYDKSLFRFSVLSNITDEIRRILGDSLKEFSEKPPSWI